MSADNWAMCPRCRGRRMQAAEGAHAAAAEAYGTVPVEEFDAQRAEADRLSGLIDRAEATFREDYEITGADEGTVQVSYSGNCRVCGLTLTFFHEHPLG